MNLLHDVDGKISSMRTAQLTTTFIGCIILLAIAFGYARPESSGDALVLIGIGMTGKVVQKATENRKG